MFWNLRTIRFLPCQMTLDKNASQDLIMQRGHNNSKHTTMPEDWLNIIQS